MFTSGNLDYQKLLQTANPKFEIRWPADECHPISLNYTSGTTSSPKGVLYSHRGAYPTAIAAILLNDITVMPVYPWTVPMFTAMVGAFHGVCQPRVSLTFVSDMSLQRPYLIILCSKMLPTWVVRCRNGFFDPSQIILNLKHAPTILNMIVNAPNAQQKPLPGKVTVTTGAAPPPAPVLFKMEELGFHMIHSYGLTETYGPASVCTWRSEWNGLPPQDRARIK
ncbi:hypothetical protein Taro_017630 [Colocasia esculenta]|uniref:4-coumarate--CoA ligase n=1 Tax=Colocasia esculenta TaxID=4460 RepID=A0A843URN1_COLES|nr:hypothetical protein [Colocasia esculenta]